jgi:hypothetical protein
MKDFSRKRYLVGQAAIEVRLIYTFFLIFMLCGFVTIAGYEFTRIGFGAHAMVEHYLGSEGTELRFPREFGEILETAHFHAFIMGIIFMTLAHLFVATTPSLRFRLTVIIAAFVCTFLDLILPAAIRYGSPAFAPLLVVAWSGEWLTYMAMILVSLLDIWIIVPRLED